MNKEEKIAYAHHKIMKGLGIFLFGIIWMYFSSFYTDVWGAFPPTLAIIGLLLVLLGLFKKSSV